MAKLTASERTDVWANWMRTNTTPTSVSKSDILSAIGEIDDWIEIQVTTAFLTMSEPARSELTARQKTAIFAAIISKRKAVSDGA